MGVGWLEFLQIVGMQNYFLFVKNLISPSVPDPKNNYILLQIVAFLYAQHRLIHLTLDIN